jgi:hypothetical protein
VFSLLGKAYALPLEIETDADLDEEMSLEARMNALNSLSQGQDFEDLLLRVIVEFAPAVANDLSEWETVDVYSPQADDEVQMRTITTSIDEDDLYDIVTGFGENLEANEELVDDLQALVDSMASAAGEDVDIEDIIDQMVDADEDDFEDMDNFEFSWTVYQYRGEYVGITVAIETDDMDLEATLMTEYSNDTIYTSVSADYNGDEVIRAQGERVFSNNEMTFDMEIEITIPEEEYSEEMSIVIEVTGNTVIEKDSNTEYAFEGDFSIEIDAGDAFAMLDLGDTITLDIEVTADCEFGSDLESIKDDDDWNEIYDQDWGDFEDLFEGLANMPFDLPMGEF